MALHEPPSGAAAEITGSFSQHQQQLCRSCLSECNVGDEIEVEEQIREDYYTHL